MTAINMQMHISEANDSNSMASFAHMASGINVEPNDNQTILQSVTEE